MSSRRNLLSALGSAGRQNLAAATGAHSGTETMNLCSLTGLRLKCHLHVEILLSIYNDTLSIIKKRPSGVKGFFEGSIPSSSLGFPVGFF